MLPLEIVYKILDKVRNDIDKKNLISAIAETETDTILIDHINKMYKYKEILNIYIDVKIINQIDKKYNNIKSYILSNNLLTLNTNYFKVCKIYLTEIMSINILEIESTVSTFPKIGTIEIFIGQEIKSGIYTSKIIYKKYTKNNKKRIRNRKYVLFETKYAYPLSYMRNIYINKNWDNLLKNNNKVLNNNERFSNRYILGPTTYKSQMYEPKNYLNLYFPDYNSEDEDEWVLIYTMNSKDIFINPSEEMISFFIKRKQLENMHMHEKITIKSFAVFISE